MEKTPQRLGLIGLIKARILARKYRRRWKRDPEFRKRIAAGVQAGFEKLNKKKDNN